KVYYESTARLKSGDTSLPPSGRRGQSWQQSDNFILTMALKEHFGNPRCPPKIPIYLERGMGTKEVWISATSAHLHPVVLGAYWCQQLFDQEQSMVTIPEPSPEIDLPSLAPPCSRISSLPQCLFGRLGKLRRIPR